MKEALLYDRLDGSRVRCRLCAHGCTIADGKRGLCGVRENRGGTLYSLVYGQLVAQAVDPIEKKPLFHFHPGTSAFSIATAGCNLRCAFCQNADISQVTRERGQIPGRYTTPEAVIQSAQRYDCASIAYTYSEPTVFYEYTLDIARLAHDVGIANVYVTNGYMSADMLDTVTSPTEPPIIDAANVDLKAFRDAFYRERCGASLQPVLDSLKTIKARRVWLEVTTLVIPGLNDSDEELGEIAAFVAQELGVDTPWHVSRFHATYQMRDRPPTPVATLRRAREIGLAAGLRYVYEGNVPTGGGENTICPHCGETVIARQGFAVLANRAHGGACAACGGAVDGVGL